MTAPASVVRAGEGEDVGLGRIILPGASSAGRLSIIEMRGRPGVVVPPHIHRDAEEIFYILEGEVIVRLGADEVVAGVGDLVVVPRGVAHGHRNDAAEASRWLTLFSPAGTEGYFADRAHAAAATPSDVERDYAGVPPAVHDALRARYGIEVVREP